MFDKLIVSEPEGADFKNRRNYFMVSSVVVGVLFVTAVVISIFAADIGLGNGSFELTEMIAPVDMAAVDPETPEPQRPTPNQSPSQLPSRRDNIARVDEATVVPMTTSVVPNTQLSRPLGDFVIRPFDSNPVDSGTSGRAGTIPDSGDTGLSASQVVVETVKEPESPPVVKAPPIKTKVSGGVLNGKATNLPKPIYSLAARAVGAEGKVDVQVTIDEYGKVVSANAVSGHPLLKPAAERAAWGARFSPTLLSNVPVKVTGVIVYNFTR